MSGANETDNIAAGGFTVQCPTRVSDRHLAGLADVLIDCVEGGASVSYMHPVPRTRALSFWREVADAVRRGERALLIAEDGEGVIGTVQLILHQPENQP